jgi:Icc-related predicted phosphoesterase
LRFFPGKADRGPGRSGTRIFFATDVHGSERCFRKFLNAAKFYSANVLILGGDMAGKMLVPVEDTPRGWHIRFRDNVHQELSDAAATELEQQIHDVGMYPIRGTKEQLLALEDPAQRETAFEDAVVKQMARWMQIADERLRGSGVRCFVAPGNDDPWGIDAVLQQSSMVEFAEGKCLELEDGTQVITTGYSNLTPWNTPREVTEAQLSERLESMFSSVTRSDRLVLVAHPPPKYSSLDQAPKIDEQFRVQMDVGSIRMTSVGSSAVREFIEAHQPLLGLHGHVHESKGAERIGRTLCVNPGSEYGDGVLCGALITLRDGTIASCQFVAG